MTRARTERPGVAARMRIIGGAWKRTPLKVVEAPGLRPTPDRVRETLFNWIAHLIPDLKQVRALDLFAGSGALGFEVASRGARAVTLVESHGAALAQLHELKAKLAATEVAIVAGEAFAFASRQPSGSFDLIFLDPPFDAALGRPALGAVHRLLAQDGLVYFEAAAPLVAEDAAHLGYELVRAGRAGAVAFHLLRQQSA